VALSSAATEFFGAETSMPVNGIGGSVTGRRDMLMMCLCGRWLRVPVLFCPNQKLGLLGREGAFDNLFVAFAHGQNTFFAVGV
jgi:hypothetical protein